MTKKEIIKNELQGIISVPYDICDVKIFQGFANVRKGLAFNNITIVDLDKLSEFLANHLDIKPEELIK